MNFLYCYHGKKFAGEFRESLRTLKTFHPDATVRIISPTEDAPEQDDRLEIEAVPAAGELVGYAFKVAGIVKAVAQRTIFLDTDTAIQASLQTLWQATGFAGIVGVADPLLSSFRHIPWLRRPDGWAPDEHPLPELNSGVLALNPQLLPAGFIDLWWRRHLELSAVNGDIAPHRIPDQPSLRQAIIDTGVVPLFLGAEYNYRPYYPQTVYARVKIVHAHFDSAVSFKGGVGEDGDVTSTFPWGAKLRRGSFWNRGLYAIYRASTRLRTVHRIR